MFSLKRLKTIVSQVKLNTAEVNQTIEAITI